MNLRLIVGVSLLLPLSAVAQPNPDIQALRQQIVALQLDHALNLTQPQAQALLQLLQDARSQVDAAKTQRAASQPALIAALEQAVTDLKTTGAISASTTQAIVAARGTPSAMRGNLRAVWQQARALLTPGQLEALETTQLGISSPPRQDDAHRGRSHAFARRFQVVHAALSDAFLALVQARAG